MKIRADFGQTRVKYNSKAREKKEIKNKKKKGKGKK